MPWNPRIIQNNRSIFLGIFGTLLNLLEGWQNAGLDQVSTHQCSILCCTDAGTSADTKLINLNGGIKNHASKIPKWSSGRGCRAILLLQPSSAAAKRVFSLLANSFKEQQTHALEDNIKTSVMLQYNKWHLSCHLMRESLRIIGSYLQ